MANQGHPIFQGADGHHYHGVRRALKINSPAAGADFKLTVPGGVQWRLLVGVATLTTSAVVANRSPSALITVEGATVWQSIPFFTLAASLAGRVTFQKSSATLSGAAPAPPVQVPIPSVWLPDGATFALSTALIDVADQWSGIVFWLEEQYETDQSLESRRNERDELRAELLDQLAHAAAH